MRPFHGVDRELRYKASRRHAQPKMRPISTYRVGELYYQGQDQWREGAQLTYDPSTLELAIFRRNISDELIADVQRGLAEFAMIVDLPLVVLAYQFGNSIDWNDVPYCWHLQPSRRKVIPTVDPSPEARILLWVSLVGADDGIIYAQRGLTLAPSFTFAFRFAIRAKHSRLSSPNSALQRFRGSILIIPQLPSGCHLP